MARTSMTLPAGFTVRLNSMTDIVDGGVALVGGSPTRYVRLSAAAQKSIINREVSAATPIGAQLADKLLELAMVEPVVDLLPECDAEYTIVIPVMNRATSLARLLSSIVDATAPAQPRIIVVDDASANPQEIEQVALRFGATFHGLETNQGPATARNAGLALVDTEFVVFLDSDVVINPATIPTLLKHFADPKVAIAAPRISALNHNGGWIAQYEDTNSSLDLGAEPSAIKPRSKMSWTSSSALVARTLALADGFDSQMRIGEDVDLIWRLSKAGWRIRYEPAAVAQHEHRAGFVHWFKRRFDYGTGAVPLARRHPEAIAPAILAPWGIGVILALLIQRKWSLPLALGIAVWAAFSGSRRLASAQHPLALSVQLTAKGVGSAYTQASALILRHWWPLTFIGCLLSRRIRKATLALALADIGLDYVRKGSRLDPVRFGAARRLDDIAYGAGVWLASLRAGTLTALTPQITRSPGNKRD